MKAELTRPKTILFSPEQDVRLRAEAERQGKSMGDLVRQAVEHYLGNQSARVNPIKLLRCVASCEGSPDSSTRKVLFKKRT
jgi:hypothetical protein